MSWRVGVAAGLVILATAPTVGAQSQVRQATPEEVAALEGRAAAPTAGEVGNPMLIEVSLAGSGNRRALWDLEPGLAFVSRESGRFVVDKARITHVMVTRGKEKRGRLPLTIRAALTSEWYRQDVDLTIVLETEDGQGLGRKTWDDLTLGNSGGPYAGRTRTPELEVEVPVATWNREFTAGRNPKIRVLMEVQGDEDDD